MFPFSRHSKGSVQLASLGAALAGLLHLFPSALTHLTPNPPLETAFFVSIGVTQLVWAYEFNRHDTEKKYRFGLFLNGGAAMLWIFTRTLVAPFSASPEHIGLLDTTVLILEVISIIGLMAWHHAIKQNVANVMVTGLVTILISGSLFYGGARSLEIVFPDRESAHGHEGGMKKNHADNKPNETESSDHMKAENNLINEKENTTKTIDTKQSKDNHDNDDGHHDD